MDQHRVDELRRIHKLELWKPEHRPHAQRVADAVIAWLSDANHTSSVLIEVPPEAASIVTTMCDALFSCGLNSYIENERFIRVVMACKCRMKVDRW